VLSARSHRRSWSRGRKGRRSPTSVPTQTSTKRRQARWRRGQSATQPRAAARNRKRREPDGPDHAVVEVGAITGENSPGRASARRGLVRPRGSSIEFQRSKEGVTDEGPPGRIELHVGHRDLADGAPQVQQLNPGFLAEKVLCVGRKDSSRAFRHRGFFAASR
jgi:hypothetical protein